ncbi:MAG: rRNA maturation RNase YbeY [Lentimicrobiaceae bacterium]|nr:rRNA maturation RNase YbeY [Lentimicrobiaceae bacterium]MCO5265057.1 rRNA maturation RNase YbeY [Lentimicrobium sp.]
MINFFNEDISFTLKNKRKTKAWLSDSIKRENYNTGDISFIFCSDDFLHKMNVQYLNHDTLTDVITFDYSEDKMISGDIFISIPRVKDNAVEFEKKFSDELNRVMVHGIMHLCGYKDKTKKDAAHMRLKEEEHLAHIPS